jgi:hypothetical protein
VPDCHATKKGVHCDANLAITAHSLSTLYVEALFKLRAAVRHSERNSIPLRNDMRATGCPFLLSDDQWTNFGKLRYFGLAHHADRENPRSGKWYLPTISPRRRCRSIAGDATPTYRPRSTRSTTATAKVSQRKCWPWSNQSGA